MCSVDTVYMVQDRKFVPILELNAQQCKQTKLDMHALNLIIINEEHMTKIKINIMIWKIMI